MKAQEIENTLYNLRYTLEKQRHIYGNENKITVRIGCGLAAWIRGYNKELILNYREPENYKSIFGYPVEIDYVNPMCLEVHFIEQVHVSKGA